MSVSTGRRTRMTRAEPRLISNCDSPQPRREPSPSPWTWTVRSTPCLSKSTAPWCSGPPKTGGSRPAHGRAKSPWAAPTTRTSLRSCRWAPLTQHTHTEVTASADGLARPADFLTDGRKLLKQSFIFRAPIVFVDSSSRL